MPELKATSLLVGRKALHSKGMAAQNGSLGGGYVPSQMDSSKALGGGFIPSQVESSKALGGGYVPSQVDSSKVKPSFQVRTDWRAKYLK